MLNFMSVLSDVPATGHVFVISGKSAMGAQRFTVSLACGKSSNSDIALMLLVNFSEGKIVRSSLVNGSWSNSEDDENLTSAVANPLKAGDDYEIFILLGDDRFHVSIDDKAFCTYAFKTPAKEIRAVAVSGDVETVVQVDHRLVFPLIYPLVNNDTPDIAFSGMIPRKIKPGHVSVFSAIASGNPDGEFVVFFNENDRIRQLIHFNARFDAKDVVVNTMHGDDDGSWGDSEVHSHGFPFVLNQPFRVAIAFSENDFKAAVNGQFLMSFPLDNIDLEDIQSLWDILTGFQIKVGSDLRVQVTQVEHIQTNDRDCDGFENYSNFYAN